MLVQTLQHVEFRGRLFSASRAVCPTPLTVATEGDDVTLPCYLDPEVDAASLTFDWKKDGSGFVYVHRYGRPDEDALRPEYRNRTRVDPVGLKRGNLPLVICSVKQSDSGSYRCFYPRTKSSCYANLTVEPKRLDSITTDAPTTEDPEPKTQQRTIPPTSEDPGGKKKWDLWMILGPLLGVVGLLGVFGLLRRRRRRCIVMASFLRTSEEGVKTAMNRWPWRPERGSREEARSEQKKLPSS